MSRTELCAPPSPWNPKRAYLQFACICRKRPGGDDVSRLDQQRRKLAAPAGSQRYGSCFPPIPVDLLGLGLAPGDYDRNITCNSPAFAGRVRAVTMCLALTGSAGSLRRRLEASGTGAALAIARQTLGSRFSAPVLLQLPAQCPEPDMRDSARPACSTTRAAWMRLQLSPCSFGPAIAGARAPAVEKD
jgi:hypothetical protein